MLTYLSSLLVFKTSFTVPSSAIIVKLKICIPLPVSIITIIYRKVASSLSFILLCRFSHVATASVPDSVVFIHSFLVHHIGSNGRQQKKTDITKQLVA